LHQNRAFHSPLSLAGNSAIILLTAQPFSIRTAFINKQSWTTKGAFSNFMV